MKTYKIQFYRSRLLRKWRWRAIADNGNITGASSQGYWNYHDCMHNAKMLGKSLLNEFGNDEN
jgi:hypothetical protein